MFSFLNIALLLGLPAALLPLIIHLFMRRRLKTVPFSSLVFLRTLERQRMRNVKLYQWLLLAVRTVIIVLLILAFARPALKGVFTAGLGARARSTAVILLDSSGSMGVDTRSGVLFENARRRVRQVLDACDREDRIHLVVFNDRIAFMNEEPTGNRAWLEDVLNRTECSSRSTDPALAFGTAARLLRQSSDVNREIFLVSDMAGSMWRDSTGAKLDGVAVFLAGPGNGGAENVAVYGAGPQNQIVTVSRPLRIAATVNNFGTGAPLGIPVSLYIEGERVNEAVVTVPAGDSRPVSMGYLPERPGLYGGYVQAGDDALGSDNRSYFTFRIPDRVRVLIVHGDRDNENGPSRFIEYALAPQQGTGVPVLPHRIRQDDLAMTTLEQYGVMVLANTGMMTAAQERQTIRFVERGGGLIVLPGSSADPRSLNRILAAAGGIRILQPEGTPGQTGAFYRFGSIDYGHPVIQGMLGPGGQFESPHVYARYRLGVPAGADRIIGFSDGAAALLESRGGTHGPVYVFPFGLDPEWSNFAVRALFVPLFYRLVQYAVSDIPGERSGLYAGEPYAKTVPGLTDGSMAVVRTPDGQVHTAALRPAGGEMRLEFGATDRPGIYRIMGADREYGRFAVNAPPSEADLRSSGADDLHALVAGARIIDAENADIAQAVRNARFGREVYGEAVWLIVILLAVEMFVALAGRTGRKMKVKPAAAIAA